MRRYAVCLAALLAAVGLTACSRDDAAVGSAVRQELAQEKIPGAIDVAVSSGIVTLSGSVPTGEARDKAEDVAEDVHGVERVVNNLRATTAAGDAPARPAGIPPAVNPHAPSAPAVQ